LKIISAIKNKFVIQYKIEMKKMMIKADISFL